MIQIARIYGGSLYELAVEEKLSDRIQEQMQAIQELFKRNPDYIRLLCEPSLKKEERTGLIEQAFGNCVEKYLVNFLKLLCERGILREYEGCVEEYKRRYYADHNIAETIVSSAVPLSEQQLSLLKEKLEKQSGKKIVLLQKLESSVVAGLRVELGGKQFDGTVKGRISDVSRKLSEVVM